MADTITTGVTTTHTQDLQISQLAPNNYLTIVWKNPSDGKIVNTLDIDDEKALKYTNAINSAINNAIENNRVTYVAQNKYINLESVGRYLAQNIISDSTQRRVASALIGVASGFGKDTPNDVTNLCLNVFGDVATTAASKLGFSDPHSLFSQVAGENVISVFKELGNAAKDKLSGAIEKVNNPTLTKIASKLGIKKGTTETESEEITKYAGLLLGLTTSDTESYEITIAKRKVEKGQDYTTHMLPQTYKKDFTVILTNKVLSSDFSQTTEIKAIEEVKNKLIEIANSYTVMDIYVRLNSDVMYKKSNVAFTSLSFDKSEGSGNTYTCTFSIEPIKDFTVKTFVSTKKYSSKSGTSKGSGSAGKGSKSKRSTAQKTSSGQPLTVDYRGENSLIRSQDAKGNYVTTSLYKNTEEAEAAFKKAGFAVMKTNISKGDGAPDLIVVPKNETTIYNGVRVLNKNMENIYNPLTGKGGKTLSSDWNVNKNTGYVTRGKYQYKLEID